MAKVKSKEHAEHNECVCEYLDKANAYPDWVITTAFYTSLHYLQFKLFPLKVIIGKTSIKVEDFDHYHSVLNSTKRRLGRHERFQDLVEEKCPASIAGNYNRLLELSFTARYSNYNYEVDIVDESKSKLAEIKKYCVKASK